MSRFAITIGNQTFTSKKSALDFYKDILSRYDFGETLSNEDTTHIMMLAFKDEDNSEKVIQQVNEMVADFKNDIPLYGLRGIMVDKHPDFQSTKCFYFVGKTDEEEYRDIFSYRLAINGSPSDMQVFSRACRFSIQERIRKFKIQQFKNRPVRCAISNKVVKWEECQIDHKAPLTFSVIVKSFMVANNLDISNIDYEYENSREKFANEILTEKFYEFHKQMAVLRVVATKENLKRSGSSRIKPTKKDSTLKD